MAKADELTQLIATVADDPEVKEAARALALAAITEAATILRYGNPTLRTTIIRALLPTALASLRETPTDASTETIRTEFAAILAEVRGEPPNLANPTNPA